MVKVQDTGNLNTKLDAVGAAALLGCSVSFIRNQVKNGRLAYTQLGNRYSFEQDDVLKLIKRVEPHIEPTLDF